MDPYSRIKELEKQIFADADEAGKWDRFIRRGCTEIQTDVARGRIENLEQRIDISREEIRQLEKDLPPKQEIESVEPRRSRPFTIVTKPPVTFFAIEEVEQRLAA